MMTVITALKLLIRSNVSTHSFTATLQQNLRKKMLSEINNCGEYKTLDNTDDIKIKCK